MRKYSSVGRLCYPKSLLGNFCACTQKSSRSLLRICVYAQKIQCWKTLLSEIIIRNFYACTQKSSTSLLRICIYAHKIQQMIIIKSSNNPIVDVLRPAQKLQVWNTYIPETADAIVRCILGRQLQSCTKCACFCSVNWTKVLPFKKI